MLPANSVPDLILNTTRVPSLRRRIAVRTAFDSITYGELEARILRASGALLADGLRRGERVGLLMQRGIDAASSLIGIMAAGGTACVLDARATAGELALLVSRAGITRLVVDEVCGALAGNLNNIKINMLHDIRVASPRIADDLVINNDALLLFTTGSSGVPKAVLLSHGNLLANAHGVIERTVITPEDRLLHAMPLHHTNGINNQLIAPLACGAEVILLDRFRAETFLDQVSRYRPTYVTGVPTMYSRLLDRVPPAGTLKFLRFARCGSAPLGAELHRRIEAYLGVPLIVSYGLSEATCTSAMNPPAARKIGSVGTVLAGQEIAILRPHSEQMMASGTEGEICIRGPALMQGYIPPNYADDGPQLFNGWLRTGDLGRLDAEGYLSVSGRLKDIIIRGGENLSPAAIEAAILQHPAVKSCCVVGIPHADLGEVPAAFVVLQSGLSATQGTLKGVVGEHMSRIHIPQHIIFVNALPEIGVGKIDRKALKMRAANM